MQIIQIKQLLSTGGCQVLIDHFKQSIQQRIDDDKVRSGDRLVIEQTDPLISREVANTAQKIRHKLTGFTGDPVSRTDKVEIIRYRTGDFYNTHHDRTRNPRWTDVLDPQTPRSCTLLIYLNSAFSGGDTVFPNAPSKLETTSRRTFRPNKSGDGLIWTNLLPDLSADPTALHGSLPVTQGEKYIAICWMRAE